MRYSRELEVADLVGYLSSERYSYMTATPTQIDGGLVQGYV
jgi:hypothetical protein